MHSPLDELDVHEWLAPASRLSGLLRSLAHEIRRVQPALAEAVDAQLFRGDPPARMSYVALGRAVSPRFADEPTRGVDAHHRDELLSVEDGPCSTAQLLERTALSLEGSADIVSAGPSALPREVVLEVERLALLLAGGVVEASHGCLSQLLVIDLALLTRTDPIPFPGLLLVIPDSARGTH